jgi:hypothetical protein
MPSFQSVTLARPLILRVSHVTVRRYGGKSFGEQNGCKNDVSIMNRMIRGQA